MNDMFKSVWVMPQNGSIFYVFHKLCSGVSTTCEKSVLSFDVFFFPVDIINYALYGRASRVHSGVNYLQEVYFQLY